MYSASSSSVNQISWRPVARSAGHLAYSDQFSKRSEGGPPFVPQWGSKYCGGNSVTGVPSASSQILIRISPGSKS
ncbi:hypothetical protein D3C83_98230 [compost metagenome]